MRRTVRRCCTLVLGMALFAPLLVAQQQGLDGDFSRLSAKERSRLAREEEAAAQGDSLFQRMMAEAEGLFRAMRYEDAMAGYERARILRPLNVYPPVKIDDLRALIARRDAVRPDSAALASTAATPVPAQAAPTAPSTAFPEPAPAGLTLPPDGRAVEDAPLEFVEERFKEGNASVVQRTVTAAGEVHVYRKVTHPWGATFHFRDGLPIDARAWNDRFGGR